jgi:hypothetical protein
MNKPQPRPPLDFDRLHKGAIVPVEELEAITGYRRENRKYSLKVADICSQIRRARPDLKAHVRVLRDAIHILLDNDAESYSQKRLRDQEKGIVRIVERRAHIDVAKLTADERRKMEHNDRYNTALVLEMRKLRKQRRAEIAAAKPKRIAAGKP